MLVGAAAAAAAPALSACGFRPLYAAVDGDRSPVVEELSAIRVVQGPGRLGQLVAGHLLDSLTPLGPPAAPRYALRVGLREGREGVALEPDAAVTRFNLTLTATFTLDEADGGRRLTAGTVRAVAGYNVLRAEFANVIAERDARERAARAVADDIGTLLSVYFVRRARTA